MLGGAGRVFMPYFRVRATGLPSVQSYWVDAASPEEARRRSCSAATSPATALGSLRWSASAACREQRVVLRPAARIVAGELHLPLRELDRALVLLRHQLGEPGQDLGIELRQLGLQALERRRRRRG